ncbi:hypothetical protein QYF36_012224 [Acer negundo]|nr:hypothetical protein QYF36_012224 [Acer negundo]
MEINPRTYSTEENSGSQSDDELEDSSSIVKEKSGESGKGIRVGGRKVPNYTIDLLHLPSHKSKSTVELAYFIANTHTEVKEKLQQANTKYKSDADKHRHKKVFGEEDFVMVHLTDFQWGLTTTEK